MAEEKKKRGRGRPKKVVIDPEIPDDDVLAAFKTPAEGPRKDKIAELKEKIQLRFKEQASDRAQVELQKEIAIQIWKLSQTAKKVVEEKPDTYRAEGAILADFVCGGYGGLEANGIRTAYRTSNRGQLMLELTIDRAVKAVRIQEVGSQPVFIITQGSSPKQTEIIERLMQLIRMHLKGFVTLSGTALRDVTDSIGQ